MKLNSFKYLVNIKGILFNALEYGKTKNSIPILKLSIRSVDSINKLIPADQIINVSVLGENALVLSKKIKLDDYLYVKGLISENQAINNNIEIEMKAKDIKIINKQRLSNEFN